MAYSKQQIENLWVRYGGDPKAAGTAAAIALAESGGRAGAENHNNNGSIDRGLFQINSVHGIKSTKDVANNVRAAIAISNNGRNWKPWVTYQTGAYRKFSGGSGTGPASTATPRSSTQTRTIPGVDNSAERAQLQQQKALAVQNFLFDNNADPLSFAQQTSSLDSQIAGLQDTPARSVQVGTQSPSSSTGGLDYTARANALNAQHLPYQWGGGHGSKAVNPYKAQPVDCSGAVASVLGVDPRVSGEFAKFGKPGAGGNVTLYANSKHVLMKIRDPKTGSWHFFGTSASNPGGGAGWIPQDQISKDYLKGFTVRHI